MSMEVPGFTLFHDFDGVSYYGDIPEPPLELTPQVEHYSMELSDEDLLNKDFIDPVDQLCGALLDIGDVDFLNARQCRMLAAWLETRLTQKPLHPRLRAIYTALLDYAHRAITYDTGIVIEL